MSTFILKIFRGTPGNQYWEEFEVPLSPGLNITSSLLHVQKYPKNRFGALVTPVAWEQGCLEEVCGSCSMLINARPRQACTALIEELIQTNSTIILAPLSKFPLIKDLVVDRTIMFENLKKVRAWMDVDESRATGPGPKISQELQEALYQLSTCMTCGCCSEACPQVNPNSKFMGPAPISQARLFNSHPTGKLNSQERLRPLMEEGGVADCGNAQNCVQVCPKKIPLTESISLIGREATKQALHDFTSLADMKDL